MIQKNISILLISLLFFSCGTSKKTLQSPLKPQWVISTPVAPDYYVGVGSAIKTMDISAYKNDAKNSALSNMISSISINVSSNSVLYSFENNAGYSDDFQATIKTSSMEYLEGYELIDVFDDGVYYWEYYRLSKQKYKEIKEKRITEATGIALDYYKKAKLDEESLSVKSSMSHYIKGMEAIKPFWNETLQTEYNGEYIYMGNELFSGISSMLNSISIQPKVENITIKKGVDYSGEMLTFVVENTSGKLLSGIPIVFYANKKPLINNRKVTNANGEVSYKLSSISTKIADIQFVAYVDVESIINKATHDIKIRNLSKAFNEIKCIVNISVEKPSFFVETNESNLDIKMELSQIKSRAEQLLTEDEYVLMTSKENADYTLQIDCNTYSKSSNGPQFVAGIKGEIRILNNKGEIISSKPIQQLDGVDVNYHNAGINAYTKLNAYLAKRLGAIVEEAISK